MKYIPAEKYCASVRDGTHDTPKPVDIGYKLVTGKHIKNGVIDESDAYYISEEDFNSINKRSLVERWDVLMSMIGTVGEAAVVKNNPQYAIKNIALFKCGGSEVKGKWLAYYLNSAQAKGNMQGTMKGASQQFLSLKQLRALPVPIASECEMRKVVDILSAYDDLIENNRKQIKLLEEAAQRLYKEWFIDLRFPGHEHTPILNGIPQGWRIQTVGDIIDLEIGGGWGNECPANGEDVPGYVIRGTDINGLTHGDISSIPFRYHSKGNISSRILRHGDIIFEVSGGGKNEGVGKTVLITTALLSCFNAPVICASFCKLVRLNSIEMSYYLYESIKFWRSCGRISEFEKKSASSIINYRWKDFMNQQVIHIPPNAIMSQYNDLIVPTYDKLICHSLMIEKSTRIRNKLLSKIMSGGIGHLG